MTIHINDVTFPGIDGASCLYFDNLADLAGTVEHDSGTWSSRVLITWTATAPSITACRSMQFRPAT